MTIAELHSNEELRRREFPVVAGKVYLAHAGVSALPRRVAEAMAACAADCTLDDQETATPGLVRSTREVAARLIGARPEEIALVGPTSLALSYVAAGFPLRRNDCVVVYFDDFPSNVYPWMALADRGVEVRFLNIRDLGRVRTIDVLGQVDERTRLVALGSCHYLSGFRPNLAEIASGLRARNIALCVDGIQTLGAFPTSADWVDFLAADSHKWLLGPCGAGILYVREAWQERLRPTTFGWQNASRRPRW